MRSSLLNRVRGKYRRILSSALYRRPIKMQNAQPMISFTFDDFPRSALEMGGQILHAYGVRATFYISIGLLNKNTPSGSICSATHLVEALAQGHELGCHTFNHCDAWESDSRLFEESILANRIGLKQILSEAEFVTMSYPINTPRPTVKQKAGRYFAACRGGGQTLNVGTADLNYLHAFFLEQARDSPHAIWKMIDRNLMERGWLIFATHDVSNQPTRFGCTPRVFEDVVRHAIESGARVLPVAEALSHVSG